MSAAETLPWSDGAEAYDAIAPRYDRVPVENRINAHMRRLSLARLRAAFPAGSRVLEIGCGTGDEALDLAARGVRVVAIDPSEQMVRVARAKAAERGLAHLASFHRAAARDVGRAVSGLDPPFDGAYASFSLAYEEHLELVARGLDALLSPGARLLASVPSRLCLVELLLSLGSGRPRLAGRRLSESMGHKVGDRVVPIRAYTPRALANAFAPWFHLVRVEALPALVPPPYMNRVYSRLDGLADVLERADEGLRSRFPFRVLGDHFLAELRHRIAG